MGTWQELPGILASPFGEWIKRQVSTHVHWWFAYNDLSVRIVQSLGYPLERITPVYNAVDTRTIARDLQNISNEDRIATRRELGISSEQVAIYAGGLYPEKRLRFLLPALQMIWSDIPDFEMIFIGGGVDAGLIRMLQGSFHGFTTSVQNLIGKKFRTMQFQNYFSCQVW